MSSISQAIAMLDLELDKLTPLAKPGTPAFALLQAKSLGASFLRKAAAAGLEDAVMLQSFRKTLREEVIRDPGPADEVTADRVQPLEP